MLLSVADTTEESKWELELYMRESRADTCGGRGPTRTCKKRYPGAGERVMYVLATDPGTQRNGKVTEVKASTEIHQDEGNIVKVKVAIDRDEIGDPHPGATVTGGVYCGRRALGYVWFHEAWEWLQTHVFFYLT